MSQVNTTQVTFVEILDLSCVDTPIRQYYQTSYYPLVYYLCVVDTVLGTSHAFPQMMLKSSLGPQQKGI